MCQNMDLMIMVFFLFDNYVAVLVDVVWQPKFFSLNQLPVLRLLIHNLPCFMVFICLIHFSCAFLNRNPTARTNIVKYIPANIP